jgi:hypothetical protein
MDQVSPKRSALAHVGVRPSYVTCTETAAALVDEIIADAGDGRIAVDFETTALPSERERLKDLSRQAAEAKGRVQAYTGQRWRPETRARLSLAKAELAALLSAEDHAGRAGLDPHRSTARSASSTAAEGASP